MTVSLCRHCEKRAAETRWGLCSRCDRTPGIRLLYRPNPKHTPADEAILDRLRRRANARLPLFPMGGV